jgi:tRNA A37 threonylcarbamoyladenosine synthetase subunit TsaC/SUA5/YrdC
VDATGVVGAVEGVAGRSTVVSVSCAPAQFTRQSAIKEVKSKERLMILKF